MALLPTLLAATCFSAACAGDAASGPTKENGARRAEIREEAQAWGDDDVRVRKAATCAVHREENL